ncbi:folylpolyglutamate synthase, mitochondrial [Camelus ferus]|nr:folylpolyglutamate synthase, mitochondrial [Camelus ferus]
MEYQDAVRTLNTLQTNANYLEQVKRQRGDPQTQLEAMELYLARSGLQVEDLDQLNIIHITGTKGKGSTCAFTERILRNYGLKTGFFSSPHLVQVRERIRINGQPISPELFTKHFWRLYNRLEETKVPMPEGCWEGRGDSSCVSMPGYFRFLTLMAFHVFLQEKVDLAVMEVGIGGAYDCTNIIRKPVVCGVSSLGIDHTGLLGETMEKIAWQKGGIFKCGVPAFTVLQPDGPLAVLRDRAQQISCPLYLCPPLEALEEGGPPLTLGLEGEHQQSNATLALQLARCWLQRKDHQAHIPHAACSGSEVRVLLFNSTGDRDSAALLKLLQPCQFDYAVFCPNLTEMSSMDNADQQNFTVTLDQVLLRCLTHQQHWSRLREEQASPDLWSTPTPEPGGPASLLVVPHPPHSTSSLVFSCISHALQWISQGRDPVFQLPSPPRGLLAHPVASSGAIILQEAAAIHVLVTGSLHLVGGVLKLLEPSLSQ